MQFSDEEQTMRITIEVPDYAGPSSSSGSPEAVALAPGVAVSTASDGALAGGPAPSILDLGGVVVAARHEALSAGAAEQGVERAAMNGTFDAVDGGAAPSAH
jgi:hypothetical protein